MGFSFPKLWDYNDGASNSNNKSSGTNNNNNNTSTNGNNNKTTTTTTTNNNNNSSNKSSSGGSGSGGKRVRIVRNGKVYDVTNFVDKHPGGREVLEAHSGQDVTQLMESEQHHVHSKTAFQILDRYYIGTLESFKQQASSHELAPARVDDYYKNDIVDWDKPILHQLPGLKERYFDWAHEPVDRQLRLFHSDFVEYFSKAPWYVVPIIWLPLCLYMLWVAFLQLAVTPSSSPASSSLTTNASLTNDSSSSSSSPLTQQQYQQQTFQYSGLLPIPLLFTSGILFWTLLEYVIHRWMFHLRPPSNSPFLILMHFILHGQHHKSPMDSERLVFPPVPASCFAVLFYTLCVSLFPPGQAEAIFSGIIFGYLMYDMTHYYVHHGTPFFAYFRRLKSYHALHHYEQQELGFGISSKLWDYPFGTLILDGKNRNKDKKTS